MNPVGLNFGVCSPPVSFELIPNVSYADYDHGDVGTKYT